MACRASPARADYSYPQYLNDIRAYQASRMANDLAQLRPAPANTPYQGISTIILSPAAKRRNDNWDDEDLKPLTAEEKAELAVYQRERATRESRCEAAVAEQDRTSQVVRRGQEAFEREMAARDESRRTEAASAAELERRADAGDYAAIVQSAKEASFGSESRIAHDRVIRAAKRGDMASIERIANIDNNPEAKRYISENEVKRWRQVAVEKGLPSYAYLTAVGEHDKGDTAGAVKTLKAAYAVYPDLSNALNIVEYCNKLERIDEATAYLKEAMALDTETDNLSQQQVVYLHRKT